MREIIAAIIATLTWCAPPAEPPDDRVAYVVSSVWADRLDAHHVTWTAGDPGIGNAGITRWSCHWGWCTYTITIDPDYAGSYDIVAHEGGHVVCVAEQWDSSEVCAVEAGAARLSELR